MTKTITSPLNKAKITISKDSLAYNKTNLFYNLSRDEFEQIIAPVVKKFEDFSTKFKTKMPKIKISSINSKLLLHSKQLLL